MRNLPALSSTFTVQYSIFKYELFFFLIIFIFVLKSDCNCSNAFAALISSRVTIGSKVAYLKSRWPQKQNKTCYIPKCLSMSVVCETGRLFCKHVVRTWQSKMAYYRHRRTFWYIPCFVLFLWSPQLKNPQIVTLLQLRAQESKFHSQGFEPPRSDRLSL